MRVSLPNPNEQAKIASSLSLIDERISTQIGLIEDLKKLKSAINDEFHNHIIGEKVSFSDIGSAYSGLSGKSGDDFGCGKPFITYMNVYENSVVNETQIAYVQISESEHQNRVNYGDVLFSLSSETPEEVGVGAVYLGDSGKYYLNSFCFGVHITATDKVYPPYLAHLVSSTYFRKFVYPLAQGSTRFNLQKNDFMRKLFVLPTIEEQRKIARVLNAFETKLCVEQSLLSKYQTQKQYLLQMMFV